MKHSILFQTFRPSFLVLTPVCILLGISTSIKTGAPLDIHLVLIIFIGGISAHISVNTLNEYFDFKSGLDLKTIKTPFSGGSGVLPDNPKLARSTLTTGIITLIITILSGLYLIMEQGIQILPLGITGVLLIITYTTWLNRYPLLCLIAPGLGFGILMVVGTHVVLTGEHSILPWLVSFVPFFLVNNLLLLNQYPDIKADTSVGRRTYPIAFGVKRSNITYTFFMLIAYALILFFILQGYITVIGYFALAPMLFSIYTLSGVIKHPLDTANINRYLAANVVASILTPLLLAISLFANT